MTIDTKHLRTLAEAATPGPWTTDWAEHDAPVREPLSDEEVDALRADAESWRKYKARKDSVIAAGMGCNPLREPAVYERLRAAQAHAVMPLIGPLLDAWEGCSQNVRSEHPELDKQLRRINRTMEDAGTEAAIAAEGRT